MIENLSNNDIILALRSEIRKHNHLYYDLDSPEITDLKYDSLISKMKSVSPNDPVLNEMGNPTFNTQVNHTELMGSLDKVHTIEEINSKFMGREVCIMPKVDGLSLAVRYEKGHFDWAATRGNGKVGELVTPNAARINELPLIIGDNVPEVRGEVFIPKSEFYGIMDQPGYDNKENGYANPRNAASGAIRQKDPQEAYNRKLGYVAYKIINSSLFQTQEEVLNWLITNKFQTVDFWIATIGVDSIEWIIEHIKTASFDYTIDGAVIMLNDLKEFKDAGHGMKCPRGAVAFKYETEQVKSIARKIKWEANRSGRIVPVLNIDETEIDGTLVSKMSLHNYAWMKEKDVCVGDTILFTKANEIIPYLTEVVQRVPERNSQIPSECPSCQGPLTFRQNDKGENVDLMCENEECPAKFIKHIRRILQLFDIKGIDEKTLIKMEKANLLSNVWDIFDIDLDVLISNGFGERESFLWVRSVKNIMSTPQCLLATMGIIGWGRRMFEILFKDKRITPQQWVEYITRFGMDDCPSLNFDHLNKIDQLGDERINTLFNGIKMRWHIVYHINRRITLEYPKEISGGILEGKSFCATGTLTRKRKDIYADIESLGGEIKSGVSKDLDYLITGDATGSKLIKAKNLGINIINEVILNDMMGQ